MHRVEMTSLSRKSTLQRRLLLAKRYSYLLPAALVAVPVVAQQRDTVIARAVTVSIDRLKQQLLEKRRLEAEFVRILGTLEARMKVAAADSQRTKLMAQSQLIFGQMHAAGQEQVKLRRQIEMLCATVRKPEGWLGVVTTGVQLKEQRGDGTTFIRFLELPTVASVDAGSPADRVGVRAGDVLLEIGGQRLLQTKVAFAELLRPGKVIAIKLQRDGDTVTLLPTVEPLPEVTTTPCAWVDEGTAFVLAPMPSRVPTAIKVENNPDGTRKYSYAYAARRRRDSTSVASGTMAPVAVGGAFAFPMSQLYSANSLAGVQLVALNQESSRSLGVTHGLFVAQVAPGTPGREAGLQGGDVLVSADSVDLRSIGMLQRVISRSADRTVRLVIVRDRKQQTVQLRW